MKPNRCRVRPVPLIDIKPLELPMLPQKVIMKSLRYHSPQKQPKLDQPLFSFHSKHQSIYSSPPIDVIESETFDLRKIDDDSPKLKAKRGGKRKSIDSLAIKQMSLL